MTITVTTDRKLFRQTILNWLTLTTGIPLGRLIWGNQAAPRPALPYGMVLFPSRSVKTGLDDVEQDYNPSTFAIERVTHGPRQTNAQVEIYSAPAANLDALDAGDLLENALFAFDTEAVRAMMRAAKIGVLGQGAVMMTDEQVGDRWERRALAEVLFSYSGETFDDGGGGTGNWIETVEVPSTEAISESVPPTADFGEDS